METMRTDILLVEDSEADIELTLHALAKGDMANKIHVVHDGEEALEYLFGPDPEGLFNDLPLLILLDLKLPKVGGLEVLKRVKADPRTRIVPVVILTSSKEERDVMEGYELGVNSYIQKPVEFQRFRDTVRQLGKYWLLTNETSVRTKIRS